MSCSRVFEAVPRRAAPRRAPRRSSAGNREHSIFGRRRTEAVQVHCFIVIPLSLIIHLSPLPPSIHTLFPQTLSVFVTYTHTAFTSSNLMERHGHAHSFFDTFSNIFRRGQSSSRSPSADERVDSVPQPSGVLDAHLHSSEPVEQACSPAV
jgi:hypothetical protein